MNKNGKNIFLKISAKALLPSLILGSILSTGISTAFAADPSHLEMPHSKGTFMFEYKYMRMNMEGLRSGTKDITNATAFAGIETIVPTTMTMDMHMFMPMYNLTRNTSIMLMTNYVDIKMDMIMKNGATLDVSTSGLSDTSISLNHKFADDLLAAGIAVSIPTGSVDEIVTMAMPNPMGGTMNVDMTGGYSMQPGSGTYDISPSLTYLGAYYDLRYGAQASYKLRTGENSQGYTLGNRATLLTWLRKPAFGAIFEFELNITKWGAIDGIDDTIPLAMGMNQNRALPTSFAYNYGGTMATTTVGASIPVAGLTVGAEVNVPFYQDLNGLQMKRTTGVSATVSFMF